MPEDVEWFPILGFENIYKINRLGQVLSVKTGKILKSYMSTGYKKVDLYNNYFRRKVHLHRLLAETFLPNLDRLPTVNHKNGDRLDNSLDNLEWCSFVNQELHKNKYVNPRKRGVHRDHNRWTARITVNSKVIYIGSFKTKEEAYEAFYKTYIAIRGEAPW